MPTVQDVVEAIQDAVGDLPGMRAAPYQPPEQINQFPFAVCVFTHGSWNYGPSGMKKGLLTFALGIFVARNGALPREYEAAMAYSDSVPNALLSDPTLGGVVDTIVGDIEVSFGPREYGSEKPNTLAFVYQITVKMESVIT